MRSVEKCSTLENKNCLQREQSLLHIARSHLLIKFSVKNIIMIGKISVCYNLFILIIVIKHFKTILDHGGL